MKSTKNAYLLWMLCFVGANGIHRFYANKKVTGIVWLVTFGCLGIGQLIDLVLIPKLIARCNGVPGRVESVSSPSGVGFAPRATGALSLTSDRESVPLSQPMTAGIQKDAA